MSVDELIESQISFIIDVFRAKGNLHIIKSNPSIL